MLLEQGDLASGASGANFGNVQVEDAEFGLSLDLTLRGYAQFASLEAELDYDVGFRRTGNLLLIENAHQLTLMQERASRLQSAGVRAVVLDRDEVCRLEPHLAPEVLLGALYHPDEGMLDPFRLVHAYALRGRNLGLEVRTHTRVSGLEVRGSRIAGVLTPAGRVLAQWVILAAGAWAHELGRTAGLELPVLWVHGEAAITEPLGPMARNAMTTAAFFEATEGADEQTVGFCLPPAAARQCDDWRGGAGDTEAGPHSHRLGPPRGGPGGSTLATRPAARSRDPGVGHSSRLHRRQPATAGRRGGRGGPLGGHRAQEFHHPDPAGRRAGGGNGDRCAPGPQARRVLTVQDGGGVNIMASSAKCLLCPSPPALSPPGRGQRVARTRLKEEGACFPLSLRGRGRGIG